MKLRCWIATIALAGGAVAGARTGAVAAAPAGRPNILFILCDDLGYGDLASFGSPVIKTPHLDRLGREGMRLTSCYSASPVCSPSRAGIMTGRNPNRLGIRDWIPPNTGIYLRKEETTVAEALKAAGYRTAHVGKWHLNSKMDGSEPTPGDHGFDHWFATQNNAVPSHQDPVNFIRNGNGVGPLKGNSSTIIADEAIRFIRSENKQPFAAFVWFHAPHEPVATPEEFTRPYAGQGDSSKAVYYGSVSLVDHEVGRLLKTLDDAGLRDTTLVMFTSDNGPETLNRYPNAKYSHGSPGPYRGMKLHITEAGYRVPGIIRWPGKTRAGQVCDEPVSGLDVLPTFCEIAGAPVPADRELDGASFMPIFAGKSIQRATPLYWEYDRAISRPWTFSLREGPWKLLGNPDLTRFELYHLLEDAGEAKERSGEHPERVREMAATMRRLHSRINQERP